MLFSYYYQSYESSTTSNTKQAKSRDLQEKDKIIKQQASKTSNQNKQLAWRKGVRSIIRQITL